MRVWLYDTLVADAGLRARIGLHLGVDPLEVEMANRIKPRQSETKIPTPAEVPYLIYGLGNETNEQLAEANDHLAERQFFSIWIHDMGGDYSLIDDLVELVKAIFREVSAPEYNITQVIYLETSQEFENQTYNTIFRYVRFQAIVSKGEAA